MGLRRKSIVSLLLMSIISFVIGCSGLQTRMMVNSMVPLMKKMDASINKSDDYEMLRDGLPYSLIFIDGLLEVTPDNRSFLLKASEAYSGYSFAFVEDNDPERASRLYLKAKGYALRTLKWNKDFINTLDKPLDDFLPTLKKFGKYDVPGLFWTANAWLSWISLNLDNPQVFVDLSKAEAIVKRILELDENYYYGMAHTIMGTFYAAPPKLLGGDPVKAKYHFDKAFEISKSKFLVVQFLYAKFYAYQIQDRDLFVKTLEYVISAPDDLFPEKRFANIVAKRKAKKLLDDIDEYF